jgi:putative membrane protein
MESHLPEGDPRLYMAAERTFLAWLRTGIALMGFGFVVARFGLFLREFSTVNPLPPNQTLPFSLPVGIVLLALGVLVNAVAGVRHARYVRAIDENKFRSAFSSRFAYGLGITLAILGFIMAFYLAKI